MSISDSLPNPFSAETRPLTAAATASNYGMQSGGYRGASLGSQETFAWRPPTMSADAAVLPAREGAAARVDDLLRNDPHAVAGVARLVDMLVGAGIGVSAKPDPRALGFDMSNKDARRAARSLAREIGAQMESEFWQFANDPRRRCDSQRRVSMNGLFRLFARTYAQRGEATYYLDWKPADGGRYATCVRAIAPDRLSQPLGISESKLLRGGIEFADDGEPIAYWVRSTHPGDRYAVQSLAKWSRIPRATDWGRPVFVHGCEPEREDQARAITPFASLMTRLRMIGKFADTELASATVNALFAAFVKSNMPLSEATQAFSAQPGQSSYATNRIEHYQQSPPTLNGVRIPILPIGDEITINNATRQATSFPAFQAAFLQSIGAALGISYEQLSMDWSKVNYSSARAALNEVWRHIQLLFAVFTEQVVSPIYFAVMEEAFDRGYIKLPPGVPDFSDAPAAYLGVKFFGPGRGYVDPTKEAEGASMRMDALISTLERECAEQGLDYEELLDQRELEDEMLKERNLDRVPVRAAPPSGPEPTDPPADAPKTQDQEVDA